MSLDGNDLLQIKDIVRRESVFQIDELKKFIKESYQTKLEASKEQAKFKERHIDPLKMKIYGVSAVASIAVLLYKMFGN